MFMFIYTGQIIVKLKTTATAITIATLIDTNSPRSFPLPRQANLTLNTSTFLNLLMYKRLRAVVTRLLIEERIGN